LPLAHLGAAFDLPPLGPRVKCLPGMSVGFPRARDGRFPSARRSFAGVSTCHRAGTLTLPVRADVGLALTFLLSCSSLSLLLFRATKIAPVARVALVPGGAGFLAWGASRLAPTLHLAALPVTAALELAVLELVHDPAGDTFLPWGFACHLGFLLW